MISRSSMVVLCVALLSLAAGGVGAQARTPDARPGIAVLPFDNGGSYGQDKENFDALQKGIAGMLISRARPESRPPAWSSARTSRSCSTSRTSAPRAGWTP